MHDIVIVGAGPAGASFARFAADRKFDVAVIDVLELPELWSKPCGDAVDKQGLKGLPFKAPSGKEIKQKVRGLEVFAPDYSFSRLIKGPGYLIDRNIMGQRVMKEAMKRGAEFFGGTAFRDVILEKGRVCGIVAKRDGEKMEFRSRLVVDCTGDLARVKLKLPADWPVSEKVEHKVLCYRGIVEVKDVGDPEVIRIYMDQKLAPHAYWWFFPESRTTANVGLGVLPEDRELLRGNYETILSRFSVVRRIQEAGAYVPVQRPPMSLVGPGVLVLGDAAPTVNPLNGGGLNSTFAAANTAASKLEDVAAAGWSYESAWAMNDYLREGGAALGSMDILKMAFWKMDEGLMKKAISAVPEGFGLGSFSLVKALLDPKLRKIASCFRKTGRHYRQFPRSPEGLGRWAAGLEEIRKSLNF